MRVPLRLMVVTAAALHAAPAAFAACEAAVVYRSGSPAYDEAVVGIRAAAANGPCNVHYLDLADPAIDKSLRASIAGMKLVTAVGVGAYDRVKAENTAGTVAGLVLRSDVDSATARRGAVYADVPLPMILEKLRGIFPKRSRVGLIHRSSGAPLDSAVKDRARQMGYELRVVDCPGPDKLLSAFSSFKNLVDLVIAEPDTELYNSATVKPLVLASLDQRLPIVGFSASFVRAGALAGVYPDFEDAGRQIGELMNQILSGARTGSEEDIRKVKVSVNQQMVRLLGIEPARQDHVELLK